ncbi:MAG: polysulfide reductase NrfD [Chloroflexi bacterium]|nr:polysulfide reductase NrfD [Chloroflexota bacterium]
MPPVAWGWEIWLYFFIGGVAGGAVAVAALIDLLNDGRARPLLRLATIIALPLLLISLALLTIDLGRPERLTNLVLAWRPTSPMWWGTFLLAAAVAGSGLLLVESRSDGVGLSWIESWLRHFTILFSAGLVIYTAVLLADSSRPLWSATPLIPAIFALSAISTGIAALAIGSRWIPTPFEKGLARVGLPALLLEFAVIGVMLVWLFFAAGPAGAAAIGVLSDPFIGVLFWVFVVGVGLVIPATAILDRWAIPPSWRPVFILIGGLALRIVIVVGGQGTPLA